MRSVVKVMAAAAALVAAPAQAQTTREGGRGISVYGGLSLEHSPRFLLDTVVGTTTIGGTTSTTTTGRARTHNMIGGELTVGIPVSSSVSLLASGSYHRSTSSNNELPGGVYQSVTGPTILVIPNQTGIQLRQRSLTFVAGAEYRLPHQAGRLSPFFRAQAGIQRVTAGGDGIGQQRANINGGRNFRDSSFTANIGAGLDMPIGRNVDLRLIQIDYRYVGSAGRRTVAVGDRVDSLVTGFAGGSTVTSLQSVDVRVSARHDIVVGAGIVFHFGG